MSGMKKINLFVGSDIVAHREMNPVVDHMISRGIEPVLYYPVHKPSSNPNASQQMFKDYAFFERVILQEAVYPFLEEHPAPHAPFVTPNQVAGLNNLQAPVAVENVNDPAFFEKIAADPSVVGSISLRCTQMFGLAATNALKNGHRFLLNVHSGLLPEFRGLYSTPRAIAEDLRSPNTDERGEFGCTLHHIDPYIPANANNPYQGIDTGNIVDLRSRPIEPGRTVYATNIDLSAMGASAVTKVIDRYMSGESLRGYPQENSKGRYFSYASASELQEWDRLGLKMYDASEVVRTLISTFSVPGTDHAEELDRVIRKAITDYQSTQHKVATPAVYNGGSNSNTDPVISQSAFGKAANGSTAPQRQTARRRDASSLGAGFTARPGVA